MVSNGVSPEDVLRRSASLSFPESVVEYFQGKIGQPPYGFPEPLRGLVLKGRATVQGRPGAELPRTFAAAAGDLKQRLARPPTSGEVLSYLLYPKVLLEFQDQRTRYGDVSVLPTRAPLPGLVVSYARREGERLAVVEAMKMVDQRDRTHQRPNREDRAVSRDAGGGGQPAAGDRVRTRLAVLPDPPRSFSTRHLWKPRDRGLA
jgi:hypothetical protein